MGTHLQQLLRSLCLNREWNYAVFWKLRHHSQMVLTWEDAYYDSHANCGNFESKSSRTHGSLHHDDILHDPLGLVLAKMSFQVYSLGEGIIGQVAVTGKHQWFFADELAESSVLFEHCYEWQELLLAGIQTIVIAAVIPYGHGVLQLGSLNKVNEDPKQLSHLRDLFSRIHSPSSTQVSIPMQQRLQSLLHMPDNTFGTDTHGCLLDPAKDETRENPYVHYQKKIGNFHGGISSISEDVENFKLVQSVYQKEESAVNTSQTVTTSCQSNIAGGQNLYNAIIPDCELIVECNRSSSSPSLTSSLNLSGVSELHEVLAPALLEHNYPSWWEVEKSDPLRVSDIADGMEQSMLTSETGTDHLLEAVVAKFCHNNKNFKRLKSVCSSANSLLTTEKMPEPSSNNSHTVGSGCYSSVFKESIQKCLNSSESYSMKTPNGVSSSSLSLCKEQSLKPIEPAKGNKKRARPGENCRPRPRDRQLIQDRIKELRDLVPNGSKCSIDSLLERTVRHMLFLQSISKHADKLNNCARSRVNNYSGFSNEQGTSWAMEVGGDMKICPIVVESLNKNGQLLIQMLCKDCDDFLKFAEVIRGLGLIILKATTKGHGDKTWIHFVVEGKNNRNIHRVDVLWSLVQIL